MAADKTVQEKKILLRGGGGGGLILFKYIHKIVALFWKFVANEETVTITNYT